MDWLFSIIRVAGASFPVASSFVQFQAELDSKKIWLALNELSDPISHLHYDVPEASKKIYETLIEIDANALTFDNDFYEKYSKPIAVLISQGCIEKTHGIGQKYPLHIRLTDPSYIMYLCALYEDSKLMKELIISVERCEIGQLLDAAEFNTKLGLPIEVIKAVFTIYESKGYGNVSRQHGKTYTGKA